MSAISLRHVTKAFDPSGRREDPVLAVDDVSLEIPSGRIHGIIGYSGAGKSTLVRLINALETPTSGTVHVAGEQLTGLREKELRRIRLGIGMIFQQFNLFSGRNVWRNIEYPLQVAGVPVAERNTRISDLLRFVGLADKAGAYPEQLSGGQKQRVGIARALAGKPGVLLADEATSALDPETTIEVLALLKRVNAEFGTTIVAITHEMAVIKGLAETVSVMEAGRVIEEGPVFEVFSRPRTAAAQRFASTVVKGAPEGEELALLRQRHQGRLVVLSFAEGSTTQADVFGRLAARGVGFEIIHGGIDDIQGRTFGTLTLSLSGAAAEVEAVVAELRPLAALKEVG